MKGNSLANKIWIEISSKQIPKKTSTKEYLKKHAYPKIPKEKSLRKEYLERNLSPKKCSNSLSSKNYTKLWGDILCQKKMKTNLYQTIVQAAFPYKKRRKYLQKNRKNNLNQKSKKNISTKKICTKSWQETWQNSELMKSGKNVFF